MALHPLEYNLLSLLVPSSNYRISSGCCHHGGVVIGISDNTTSFTVSSGAAGCSAAVSGGGRGHCEVKFEIVCRNLGELG
ncbi:hypothetical protein AKJ16_DCAP23555 [Drosera capensis]